MSETEGLSTLTKLKIAAAAVVAVILLLLFFPDIQGLLYAMLFGTPSIAQWGIVAIVFAGIAVYRENPIILLFAVGMFVVMGLFVGPIAGSVYAHTDMANQMQDNAEQLEQLPNTSKANVRTLPRSVSDNYAQSSMQYPQFKLSESDITYRNGSYEWSHALEPDNLMVSWLGNQRGALYVNMTTIDKDVEVEDTEFTNGRGQIVFDSYKYQSVLHAPLKGHNWDTTFNAQVNGTSYIAHSTTTYQWKFKLFPIPLFYAIPQHGSVEVMQPSGSIESYSPQEAQQSELLRGQNFYPYHIAMFKVESMLYIHGALNNWFWKEDVLAIADLPESGNNWPITVPTESNGPELTYFIATEPTGSGNGVYEVWAIDSQTGEASVRGYDESQVGPQKAVDFVERRQEVNRLSNANAVAPIPIVKAGTLYWHVKVVPGSESGVIYTAFVNAESGAVTLVDGTQPIYAFMTESEVQAVQNQTDGQEAGMDVTVVVTDGEGEIVETRNITVPEGGGVEVGIQDRTGNETNQTQGAP